MFQQKQPKQLSSDFNTITISLASPEMILEQSHGEVLKPRPSTTGLTSPSVMALSVNAFLVLSRTLNATAASTSESDTKESFATDAVSR